MLWRYLLLVLLLVSSQKLLGQTAPDILWMRGGHSSIITAVAYSSDGNLLASGSFDSTVKLWQVPDGKLLRTVTANGGRIYAVAFSPDGTELISGAERGSISIWRKGEEQRILSAHNDAALSLVFSPDGATFAWIGRRLCTVPVMVR
jgi:WD40 repeat protein